MLITQALRLMVFCIISWCTQNRAVGVWFLAACCFVAHPLDYDARCEQLEFDGEVLERHGRKCLELMEDDNA